MTSVVDKNAELWRHVMAVQERRHGGIPVEQMLDDAVELYQRARSAEYEGCAARVCAYDQLVATYEHIDLVGYAPDVIASVERLRKEVTPAMYCFGCLSVSASLALRALGRFEEADELAADALRQIPDDAGLQVKIANLLTERLWVALALGRGTDARRFADEIATLAERTRRRYRLSADAIQNFEELIRETEVLALLAEGRAADAWREYRHGVGVDAPSYGRFVVQRALLPWVRDMLTEQELTALLDDMLDHARSHQYLRDLAELLLMSVDRAQQRGDHAQERARIVEARAILPRLKSTDLHARLDGR